MTDRTLTCSDCGREFVFTTAEQEFFREREYTHDPKRCLACRRRRRRKTRSEPPGTPRTGDERPHGDTESAQEQGASPPPGGAEPTPTSHRAPPDRPLHDAVCAACGVTTQVPFRPDGVRPVYCLPCLKKQTRG